MSTFQKTIEPGTALLNEAIKFVTQFYNITEKECLELYMDEVEAYLNLHARINLWNTLNSNTKTYLSKQR